MAYKLQLKGMPAGSQQFEYLANTEFFREMESADIHGGNVKIRLDVKHANGAFDLSFTMKGEIEISCDRCLDNMVLPVDATYAITVKYGADYNDESDELLVIPESESDLNVANMIYDTIALTIPLKHVHPDGQCNQTMLAELKKHTARMADADGESGNGADGEESANNDPRWDALRNLLDNK